MFPYLLRRLAFAFVLVMTVSSAALLLVEAAPGDAFDTFDVNPTIAAAERHRLGLDRPLLTRYGSWLSRAVRLDLGESVKYRRSVRDLVIERASMTALLGATALVLATLIGIPAGILTGSSRNAGTAIVRVLSLTCVSIPPLVTSFVLLLIAARTGWLPVGGAMARGVSIMSSLESLIIPAAALGLPIAAMLERLQSQAMREALAEPSMQAARARGCSRTRVIWCHALRLSLKPVLAVYGVIVGSVLSGSFAVEIVTSWPGLGALMYDGLVSRDLYLVAGCAAAGSLFLAAGILLSDVALVAADPRLEART